MKSYILILILVIPSLFLSGCRDNASDGYADVDGGNCEYETYGGIITIEKVQYQPGDSYENKKTVGYEPAIEYRFEPDAADAPNFVKSQRHHLFLEKEQIFKREIKPGKQFRVKADFRVTGTCTPGPLLNDFDDWQ